ncbi:hypothetical protein J2T56_002361 [Natronobacillus azotifigens]|uniref:Uncharacterized protein n=1 Tax=Natronobacillus azotifigens TaxID=472978 RepID=A0A9J6RFK3_9BACI|nr:hypothetical protein [Natronobacillus azotifigens]MCZ0704115.1 hypothetical protein [Natronobacillus azotifigens]
MTISELREHFDDVVRRSETDLAIQINNTLDQFTSGSVAKEAVKKVQIEWLKNMADMMLRQAYHLENKD